MSLARRWNLLAFVVWGILVVQGMGGEGRPVDSPSQTAAPEIPFAQRGYYLTLTRTPSFGLETWKATMDAIAEDRGNLVVLWIAGGFASKRFPQTWSHNREHLNVRQDFVRELIDYAHQKKIRVILGFTPFGYDGVNQMARVHPEWVATGADGKPTRPFGIHSWGQNLCPARPDARRFMLEYVQEMLADFYPNADGVLIESSDYAACHCSDCKANYSANEFLFVWAISDWLWARNPKAMIVVYPHYFTGKEVPGLGARGAKQKFDERWSVLFTPHSAPPDRELIRRATASLYWDDSPALRSPREIQHSARVARDLGCTGWIPSFEAFSYFPSQEEQVEKGVAPRAMWPLGMGWLRSGESPYGEVPVVINRVAYREFSRNPDLSESEFHKAVGDALFGSRTSEQAVQDALALHAATMLDRSWWHASPVVDSARLNASRTEGSLDAERDREIRRHLEKMREIERRYRDQGPAFQKLHRAAHWIVEQADKTP